MAISSVDISNLYFFVDTIIPSTDDMPSASEVISVDDIKWILEETQKYEESLDRCLYFIKKEPLTRVEGGIRELSDDQKIEILTLMQSIITDAFNLFVEVVYLLYYSKDQVHEKISWNTDESADENKMEKFDESILSKVKEREPFWKKV